MIEPLTLPKSIRATLTEHAIYNWIGWFLRVEYRVRIWSSVYKIGAHFIELSVPI